MSSYASPTPSSLFDRATDTPSSVSSYNVNVNAPSLAAVPLPRSGQVPNLHQLLSTCPPFLKFNTAFPFHPSTCLAPNINPSILHEQATCPPVPVLQLRISALNLVIDVPNQYGVLVGDVFAAISRRLLRPVSRDAYASLPPYAREVADRAYQQKAIHGINQPLMLVDCLGENSHFHSLVYSCTDGLWEVRLF